MSDDFLQEAYDAFVKRSDPATPCPECDVPFMGPNYPGLFRCQCGALLRVEYVLTERVTLAEETEP